MSQDFLKCHGGVTQKTPEIRPFLYIFINVMIFIYIQPREKNFVYTSVSRGTLSYGDMFSRNL
jgi:hypothetical protein